MYELHRSCYLAHWFVKQVNRWITTTDWHIWHISLHGIRFASKDSQLYLIYPNIFGYGSIKQQINNEKSIVFSPFCQPPHREKPCLPRACACLKCDGYFWREIWTDTLMISNRNRSTIQFHIRLVGVMFKW